MDRTLSPRSILKVRSRSGAMAAAGLPLLVLALGSTSLSVSTQTAALAAPTVAPAVATAATAASPGRVTLVGSLQNELGCPDDWSPSCASSALTKAPAPPGGSPGTVWSAIFTVPAGSYEFKVALNGTWDESYGADGGSANIPLVLRGPAELAFTYDEVSHAVAVAPAAVPSSEVTDQDRALAADSLRTPLTKERFYFVMADRFANGSAGNDRGGLTGGPLETGFDPTHEGFYHGGDIAGLSSKLDYIQGLGTTAIWLTPSFKNRPVQGTGKDATAGYHGYWVTDFTQIDPHLGTNAELKAFIDDAHSRGIKVFFDIITNHTADILDYSEGRYSYVSKADKPYRNAGGEVFDDVDYAKEPGRTFPSLDPAVSFPYTPVFRSEADKSVRVPAWLNDPTNYHNRGNSEWAGESNTYGDFVGLDDLFTEKPEVVKGMTDVYQAWVDFGIDGFRIDTVKHVNLEFWQQFAPAIRDHATAIGNDDFFAFGEVYDANPELTSTYTTSGRLDAVLDFGFQAAGVSFAKGGAGTKLRDFYASDDWLTDTDSNAYSMPTFLGNHDMGRVGHNLSSGAGASSGDELLSRDRLAHELMYLTRGQPVVYYGDEQGFTGDGGDKAARQDMFASQVATYNDDDLIGTDATTATDNFDPAHPLYAHLAQLSALRDRYPALADGAQLHRYASNQAGVFAVSRIDREEDREYVVAFNNAATDKTVTFPTLMRRATFRQIWPAPAEGTWGRSQVRTDEESRITLTVPAMSAVVWRAAGTLPGQSQAPAVHFDSPSAGAVVGGRAPIAVSPSTASGAPGGGFNQVTLAWRPVGTSDWTPLGTDDNAPYRVFHDTRTLDKGTLVEYRAVLKDQSNNLSVASTYAVIGAPKPTTSGGDPGTGPVTQPANVAMPGSHNLVIGCPGDWQPACDQAQLALDPRDQIWKKTVTIPTGNYEYKAAINKSWDENYGRGAAPNGANIALALPAQRDVTFFYDHRTHWITTDANGPIITLAGSLQSELGCAGDWDPACMRTWLQDPDGDGTYTMTTTALPGGAFEAKVTHGLNWAENYGQGGARDGANIAVEVPGGGAAVTFSYDVSTHLLTVSSRAAGATPDLAKAKAHWVRGDLVAWKVPDPAKRSYRLHSSIEGDLAVDAEALTGGTSVALTYDPAGLPTDVLADFPHLRDYQAFRLTRKAARRAPELLTGQLAVASYNADGTLYDATGVQIPGVLDDVYADATDRDYGVTWDRRGRAVVTVWAPTAQDVQLVVRPVRGREQVLAMEPQWDGSWTIRGKSSWLGARYLFDVTVWSGAAGRVVTNRVTDPWSLALTADSTASVMVDLSDPALMPRGWSRLRAPRVATPVDRTIYELHIRDFSIGDASVPVSDRGTYRAFADTGSGTVSAGMAHLRELARAGLNTVHLLPAFDIATIPERRADQVSPTCDLASYAPDSTEQQACIEAIRAKDGFNWGYDPLHYSVPEGSYATNPEGAGRTREFREMVAGLNNAGLQVVMDVVYNHTAASGQDPKSVLDRIVPGYYHRLNNVGAVENSTCCSNTATEHAMMEKLMIDSVLVWARDYKVNGFRFDLMGHHSLDNMLHLRAALDRLTLRRDGVDGRAIYLYGEGWNFGEVADNARFTQASQLNLAGSGIGSFSDRLRDAVRGGGPFDEDPRKQGFGSGLFTDPNTSPANGSADKQRAELLHAMDLTMLGLAGNLADYSFLSTSGERVTGRQVDYNGSPAGYAAQPAETISYVDAHDNETLYDALALKLPQATAMADRVRMNTLSLATVTLGQGVSFWHAGTDLLRSKSLDRNSYDSGDWFNRIDWTGRESTFGSGLPRQADNGPKWSYFKPLLADPSLKPGAADIAAAEAGALDLLRIRSSSRLFRLGAAEAIGQKVSFLRADPGVIVMHLDDTVGADVDPARRGLLVVFNATPEPAQIGLSPVGGGWRLHPVQAAGVDQVVKGSVVTSARIDVPARTVAVFER